MSTKSIHIDHTKSEEVLFQQQALAVASRKLSPLAAQWKQNVDKLGKLCPPRKSSTTIAALGTAILAKSTDSRVDVYSLLDRLESKNAYSARSLADNVWAKNRARLGIDLGANGVNPLNNTPFIGKTSIRDISGVRNVEGWAFFLQCMSDLEQLNGCEEAKQALCGFIVSRSKVLIAPIEVPAQAGDNFTQGNLINRIVHFVSEKSEGGRRAQAVACALLDTIYGAEKVFVGVINDPDRRAPLDISVPEENSFSIAIEVKDKPINSHHIYASLEKTARDHNAQNLVFLAISDRQTSEDFDEQIQWAAKRGIKVTVFLSWQAFYQSCKMNSPIRGIYEGLVFRNIIRRGQEFGVVLDSMIEKEI